MTAGPAAARVAWGLWATAPDGGVAAGRAARGQAFANDR
jgi:hypothetical protein